MDRALVIKETLSKIAYPIKDMTGKRLNPFQHALRRPDLYIGSIRTIDLETYLLDDGLVKIKTVKWNPGLFNIIREIGSNCIDNRWRSLETDNKMKTIKVEFDTRSQTISFWNDGQHIPVEKRVYEYEDLRKGKIISEKLYPAEVFFGEMLAGTNFEDDEVRKTSGRNGLGSKCLAPDTELLLSDGSIIVAASISIGTELLGDDGKSRTVVEIFKGVDKMYEIKQRYGRSYVVNDKHTLTLHFPSHKKILPMKKKNSWGEEVEGWIVRWWDKRYSSLCSKFKETNIFTIDGVYTKLERFCETIEGDGIIDIDLQDYLKLDPDIRALFEGIRLKGPRMTDTRQSIKRKVSRYASTGSLKVTSLGEGKYIGFRVDGPNGRFILADGTVTHNCTNVFSTFFEVQCADPITGKKLTQSYNNNARERSEPRITSYRNKTGFTKVTFRPDLERFDYKIETNGDFIGLLGLYVLEIAAMTALPVTFGVIYDQADEEIVTEDSSKHSGKIEQRFHLKSFEKYALFFYPKSKTALITVTSTGDECVIVESHITPQSEIPDGLEQPRHLSFVNGIKTKDGGVHVDAWSAVLFSAFVRAFNARKSKNGLVLKTTAKEVYPYLTLFIRTEVDKPSFDSQTKDRLNGPDYLFGNRGELKEQIDLIVKKMMKWDFVNLLEEKLTAKTDRGKTKKAKKRISMGDKAQDANRAGREPEKCTLYIAEGLSAKAMVVRGISTLPAGQDFNGVFAVQGKFISVVNASPSEISSNNEANALKEMINLRLGVDYSKDENFATLRYHKVRLTTDMDDDGIHIRGLLISFFYTLWPELFDRGFVDSLSTAVTKVSFADKKSTQLFYSNPEYRRWYDQSGAKLKIAESKYLKGLGSINPKDVPGYFSDPKIVSYFAEGDEKEYMELGFDDNKADERKDWLLRDMQPADEAVAENEADETEFVYDGELGLSTFVDQQLIIYHRMALRRALPNYIDGFKESQRKAFYAIRLRKYKKTKDLEKVMGAVKEATGYHHGGASLVGTIRGMAVRYPGSNNIALLQDDGEFGTRLVGGKDAASSRYIATALEEIATLIFPTIDDSLVENIIEDDEPAEYKFFLPVICMLLVNGAEGIASGFSTSIPNHDPKEIVRWIRAWLKGEDLSRLPKLVPWYRGITGPITLEKSIKKSEVFDRFRTKGILIECKKGCTVKIGKDKCKGENGWWHITDLPVGKWTAPFKEYLEYLESGSSTTKRWKKLENRCITDFRDYSTVNLVHFMIKPVVGRTSAVDDWIPDIDETLKCLQTTKSLNNMVAIDENNYPTRYLSAESILEKWCPKRLEYYGKRYDHILTSFQQELKILSNRYRYVKAVVDGDLSMHQDDDALEKEMTKIGLEKMKIGEKTESTQVSFEYLLSMQMRSMTVRKLEELAKEKNLITLKITAHQTKTPSDLWMEDLDHFDAGYQRYLKACPLD